MKFPNSRILIFSKAPVPGQVKTRLIPVLSSQKAVQLHTLLTLRTLEIAVYAKLCPVELWVSPTTGHPFFTECKQRFDISVKLQNGRDLGEKMNHAFQQTLTKSQSALLIGCDWITLEQSTLIEALTQLNADTDMVLGPASDGGYVLIGLKQPQQAFFDQTMPWGTSEVLAETERRRVAMDLRLYKLAEQRDIDQPEDLQFLPDDIKRNFQLD